MTTRRIPLWLIATASLATLSACSGGSSTGGTIVAPTPTPTPTVAPTPTPTPAPSPTPSPTATATSWANVALHYTAAPNVPGCQTGTLKAEVKADVLARLNAIRALHRLPPVTYSAPDDAEVAQAALMMAANGALSHNPPSSWKCYTTSGATGAGSSNLYGGTISPYLRWYSEDDYLAGWLSETASPNIGHRRWMLDPFLGKTAYGRVGQVLADGSRTDSAVMKVFGFTGGTTVPTGLPPFVAYPYGDYPAKYFETNAYLSFSVVANTAGRGGANSNVKFSGATVTVANGSTNLAVSNVSSDNEGYGLPNNIQWTTAGLAANTTYTVTIAGVTGAPQTSYTYTFRLVP